MSVIPYGKTLQNYVKLFIYTRKMTIFCTNICVCHFFVVLLQPQKPNAKKHGAFLLVTKRSNIWTIITRTMQQVHAKKKSCECTVRAKKFLGQHFLTDLNVARQIAETITSGRTLEIGPGMGVLTQFLLQNKNINLTAIELDRESVAYLKEWYPELNLIEGDFLKLDLNKLYPEGEFNVIGNYPYNISSQI